MSTDSEVYLTVQEQIALLRGSYDGPSGLGRALCALVLSTGIHPVVLSEPETRGLYLGPTSYSWRRPKSRAQVCGPWSWFMVQPRDGFTAVDVVASNLYASPQWYGQVMALAGKEAGIHGRVAPLRCRRTHFFNLAVLGLDPWSISQSSGTSMATIGKFYLAGKRSQIALQPPELAFLHDLEGV